MRKPQAETIKATREYFTAPCGCAYYRITIPGWAFRDPIVVIDRIGTQEGCTEDHTTLGAKITKGGRPRSGNR